MKLHLTLTTRKGYYDKVIIEGSTLRACLDKIIPKLEEMPPTIDGEHQMDWTKITIEILRS